MKTFLTNPIVIAASTQDYNITLGNVVLACSAVLGSYVLLLKLREHFSEKPDPKITYATIEEVERLRALLYQNVRDNHEQHTELDNKRSRSIAAVHELIRSNAMQISALIPVSDYHRQQIAELDVKINRLSERIKD